MQYTEKDYNFLGKQVAHGKYVTKSVFYLSLLVAAIGGFAAGSFFNTSSSGPAEVRREFTGSTVNNELAQHILNTETELKTDPNNVKLWVQLGNLYYDSGMPQKSINAYEKSLTLDPNNPDVLVDSGVMYRQLKQYEKAIEKFQMALKINPKHEIAYFNTGIVYLHDLNDKEKGLQAWKQLLQINPNAKTSDGTAISTLIQDAESR